MGSVSAVIDQVLPAKTIIDNFVYGAKEVIEANNAKLVGGARARL
jgi:hypothetical protein